MANELNYYGEIAQTGLTVTAKIYNSSGSQVGSAIACAEAGTTSIYIGSMPVIAAGEYGVRFFDGATLLGQGVIYWNGTKELDPLDLDGVKNILEGDMIPTPTQFSILHKDTKAVLVQKDANEIDDLTQLTE